MDGRLRNMTSLYLVREGEILCLYRMGSRVADQKFIGSAGGHFEPSELNDAKRCVLRELQEELGLAESEISDMNLRYVTYRLKNGEIRQNYYFFAGLKEERTLHSTEGVLKWIPFDEMEDLPMPVSAKHMILHYLQVGRFTDLIYGGITQEKGTSFVPLVEFEG